jgi:hypothetical protein
MPRLPLGDEQIAELTTYLGTLRARAPSTGTEEAR